MDNRGIDTEPGRDNRQFQKLWKAIDDIRSERRGRSTTISDGDLIIENGGNVRVLDNGAIIVDLLGRIVKVGSTTWTHLADGWLWVETLVNPSDPLQGGTYPKAVYQQNGFLAAQDATKQINVGVQADGSMLLASTVNKVAIQHNTTSSSANTVMDAFGTVTRSTSSRRYKQDIEDAVVDAKAVLKLRPRTWRDRREVREDPDTETRYVGFIAEELHDAGLGMFVEYDDEDRPDAIAYDRLAAALIVLAQAEHTKLNALEATVQQLADKVATLSGALQGPLSKGIL